jgi:hypothetical protein
MNRPEALEGSATPNASLSSPRPEVQPYERYTLDRYHASIGRLASNKRWYAGITIATVISAGLAFSQVHYPRSSIGHALQWLTVVWLLPVPLIALSVAVYYLWFRADRFVIHWPSRLPPPAQRPTVNFQVTSTGVNVETVLHTVGSIVHWTRRHPEICYDPVVWLVVEEWGIGTNQARFDALQAQGVRVVVTPVRYRTPKGTTRKGRSLHLAVEERRKMGIPLDRLWVYHHDDETAIGEDTVLGIDEFLRQHSDEKALGMGIILYPQQGEDLRPSQVQEFNRTKDDLRTIFTVTSRHNMFSGFHGSHYLVRADVEDETGWDVGPDMSSEDLIFENLVRRQHGPIAHLLKGFAYEQAALNLRDQLRQRRRWFQGWWRAVFQQPFSAPRRFVMTYSMMVWMAAVLSVSTMILSWIFDFSAPFFFAGALAGFVWSSMIIGYHTGYTLHVEYLGPRTVPLYRVVANGIVGALLDGVAPWYGVLTRRPKAFQVISKDGPAGRPAPALPRGANAASAS